MEDAADAFEQALDLKPECVEAMAGQVLVLFKQKKYREGLAHVDQCRDLERFRALAPSGSGDPPEPRTDLDHFLAGASILYGYQDKQDRAEYQAALDHARMAVFLAESARPIYYHLMAHAAGKLGDEVEASRIAEALTTLWGESDRAMQWAKYTLGDGNKGKAGLK
jgi:tetratricopeptide (TPR) repeat protein